MQCRLRQTANERMLMTASFRSPLYLERKEGHAAEAGNVEEALGIGDRRY